MFPIILLDERREGGANSRGVMRLSSSSSDGNTWRRWKMKWDIRIEESLEFVRSRQRDLPGDTSVGNDILECDE